MLFGFSRRSLRCEFGGSLIFRLPPHTQHRGLPRRACKGIPVAAVVFRLPPRPQLQRLASVGKYVGIAIVAIITILGIKTVGDLHSVAETLVKDSIEKKDPAAIYRKSIDELYAQILIASGLSQVSSERNSLKDSFSLSDSEYNHVLAVLLQ